MALQSDDWFYVQRGTDGHKITYEDLQQTIVNEMGNYLPLAGGTMSGAIITVEQVVPAGGSPDFGLGPFHRVEATTGDTLIAPQNPFNGMSGLIRTEVDIAGYSAEYKHPGGTTIAATAGTVIPFYVKSATEILLGNPIEVS
jgi:hypothetical protein